MTLVLLDEADGARLVARVPQGDARAEHVLRDLIYDHPAMVPVGDIDPSFGRLFAVARELSTSAARGCHRRRLTTLTL